MLHWIWGPGLALLLSQPLELRRFVGKLLDRGEAPSQVLGERHGDGGHPAIAVVDDAVEDGWAGAAEDDRRVRVLHRLGPLPGRGDVDMAPVVLGNLVRPEGLDRLHLLPHEAEAGRGVDAVGLHLLVVPAGADAEDDATVGDLVEGRDLLGRVDGVALGDEGEGGDDLDLLGDGGGGGQRDEGVEHALVAHGRLGGEGEVGREGHVRVLGHAEALEADTLGLAGDVDDARVVVRGCVVQAEFHGVTSRCLVAEWRAAASRPGRRCARGRARGSGRTSSSARPSEPGPATFTTRRVTPISSS